MTTEPKGVLGGYEPKANALSPSDPPPVREAVAELIEATRAHFSAWMQDEADDEGPVWTGCSIEEHLSAKRVKEALAALTGETSRE